MCFSNQAYCVIVHNNLTNALNKVPLVDNNTSLCSNYIYIYIYLYIYMYNKLE